MLKLEHLQEALSKSRNVRRFREQESGGKVQRARVRGQRGKV